MTSHRSALWSLRTTEITFICAYQARSAPSTWCSPDTHTWIPDLGSRRLGFMDGEKEGEGAEMAGKVSREGFQSCMELTMKMRAWKTESTRVSKVPLGLPCGQPRVNREGAEENYCH